MFMDSSRNSNQVHLYEYLFVGNLLGNTSRVMLTSILSYQQVVCHKSSANAKLIACPFNPFAKPWYPYLLCISMGLVR